VKNICTVFLKTSNQIINITSLYKCVHNNKSEMDVNINNTGELVTLKCVLSSYVYILLT